eukprot:TRINITY_DN15033_c0_g1_i1.p1 TRINITY_DN15033_c0_g1~~TRINITY_DN15033_c0_g1_i1.p1  ORF type:complete len:285 (+),score=62.14 TRINITY_DN15033_c0_g1_i1:32-886(+)
MPSMATDEEEGSGRHPEPENEYPFPAVFVAEYAPYTKGFKTHYVDSERDAQRHWDRFYQRNGARFFKDRHYFRRELPELFQHPSPTFVEFGCGVGNTLYPVLAECAAAARAYCCDFSQRAVQLVTEHPEYDPKRVTAFVHDLTKGPADPRLLPDASCDFATLIFVLSAVPAQFFLQALKDIRRKLKPAVAGAGDGGLLYFRDYAREDMAQKRFRTHSRLDDATFVRHDGTRSYFFSVEEVDALFAEAGFEPLGTEYIRRKVENVKEEKTMDRTWLHGKFRVAAA